MVEDYIQQDDDALSASSPTPAIGILSACIWFEHRYGPGTGKGYLEANIKVMLEHPEDYQW